MQHIECKRKIVVLRIKKYIKIYICKSKLCGIVTFLKYKGTFSSIQNINKQNIIMNNKKNN